MNKTLKANYEFFYGGKTLKAGEEFQAADPDANILCVLGKATEVDEVRIAKEDARWTSNFTPPVEAAPAQTKIEEPSVGVEESESRPARRYKRRDMRAEE